MTDAGKSARSEPLPSAALSSGVPPLVAAVAADGKPGGTGRRAARGTAAKSARRRARELALQGLYQWLLAREDSGAIHAHLVETPGYEKADHQHLDALLHGVIRAAGELDLQIEPHLDRRIDELSPVEHAVLMLATFELLRMPEIPYRVVLNEAVEITKSYGGPDGFKYVNGVLDRVAERLRPLEFSRRS